jgi:hypothetical protein
MNFLMEIMEEPLRSLRAAIASTIPALYDIAKSIVVREQRTVVRQIPLCSTFL